MSDHEIREDGLTRREALKRGAIFGGVALAWTTPLVQVVGMSPALAQTTSPVAGQGCSHGFWKNHEEEWLAAGILPGDYLSKYFSLQLCAGDKSLMEALQGSGPNKAEILLVQAVAALLNAAHPQVAYPMTRDGVAGAVNSALQGCDDSAMLALKNSFDSWNNSGSPLCSDFSSEDIHDSLLDGQNLENEVPTVPEDVVPVVPEEEDPKENGRDSDKHEDEDEDN